MAFNTVCILLRQTRRGSVVDEGLNPSRSGTAIRHRLPDGEGDAELFSAAGLPADEAGPAAQAGRVQAIRRGQHQVRPDQRSGAHGSVTDAGNVDPSDAAPSMRLGGADQRRGIDLCGRRRGREPPDA